MDSQSVAADGKTKVYGAGVVGAMPLMVRAVDFNALHAECVRLRSAVMSGEGEWVGHKELAALRKDAERYRKLRAQAHSQTPLVLDPLNPVLGYTPEGLDDVLDAMPAVGAA